VHSSEVFLLHLTLRSTNSLAGQGLPLILIPITIRGAVRGFRWDLVWVALVFLNAKQSSERTAAAAEDFHYEVYVNMATSLFTTVIGLSTAAPTGPVPTLDQWSALVKHNAASNPHAQFDIDAEMPAAFGTGSKFQGKCWAMYFSCQVLTPLSLRNVAMHANFQVFFCFLRCW
jgi:hypothetical protein